MTGLNETNICSDHTLVRKIYDYNPDTGAFIFRVQRGPMRVGQQAGSVTADGYVKLRLGGKYQYAHRLAFLWMTGEWPEDDVDHRDTDRTNNAWYNLRVAGSVVNNRNKSPMKNNTSGHVGVSWDSARGLWEASIGVEGKKVYLGRHAFYQDAVTARLKAEIKYGYAVDKVWDAL